MSPCTLLLQFVTGATYLSQCEQEAELWTLASCTVVNLSLKEPLVLLPGSAHSWFESRGLIRFPQGSLQYNAAQALPLLLPQPPTPLSSVWEARVCGCECCALLHAVMCGPGMSSATAEHSPFPAFLLTHPLTLPSCRSAERLQPRIWPAPGFYYSSGGSSC